MWKGKTPVMTSNSRVTNSNPRVTSSNPRVNPDLCGLFRGSF